MTADDIVTRRLVLRLLSLEALVATEAGRIDEAAEFLGLELPADWDDVAPLARRRLPQLAQTPTYRPWSIRAVALKETGVAIGYVNFHDLPAWHDMAGREAC